MITVEREEQETPPPNKVVLGSNYATDMTVAFSKTTYNGEWVVSAKDDTGIVLSITVGASDIPTLIEGLQEMVSDD